MYVCIFSRLLCIKYNAIIAIIDRAIKETVYYEVRKFIAISAKTRS
jgi:hypothetical protein